MSWKRLAAASSTQSIESMLNYLPSSKKTYLESCLLVKNHQCSFKLHWGSRQSHLFLFLVKFLRKSYLIPFFNNFKRIVFFVITNHVFDLLIHVSINYLLFMIFLHLLIVTHPKRWVGYFLIYLKPLIEYGMKGSSTKWNVLYVCL